MRSFPIPGTHVLTDIAPKEMMADSGAVAFRYLTTQFDCGVRNAFPAIKNVRLHDRCRWTGVDAPRARSATIGHGCVVIEVEIGQNAAEKKPGSSFLIDDARILSEPTHSGVLGIHTLE